MENKTCLVIYIGNGYSEGEPSYYQSYIYSVDMRDNQENHEENIYKPLRELGYTVDTTLITNKHKRYDEFVEHYNAIRLDYTDFTPEHFDILEKFYRYKINYQGWGPGSYISGGRLLNLHEELPEYDIYVFVRADTNFKQSLSDLNVDYNKINYLWRETDYRFFHEPENPEIAEITIDWPWNTYRRINGNVLNVVNKKYINIFKSHYWLDHMSLYFMLKDFSPLITYENDINLMCGEEEFYAGAPEFCSNPVYTFNKKIISSKDKNFKYN